MQRRQRHHESHGSFATEERYLESLMQRMAVLLLTVKGMWPFRFSRVAPTLDGLGQHLDSETVF